MHLLFPSYPFTENVEQNILEKVRQTVLGVKKANNGPDSIENCENNGPGKIHNLKNTWKISKLKTSHLKNIKLENIKFEK